MLKTCQLVNILGGTVVYKSLKTIIYGWVFFSFFFVDKITSPIIIIFFFLMKGEALRLFLKLLLASSIQMK